MADDSIPLKVPLFLHLQVATAGTYKVSILYTSKVQAQFKLSVGTYQEIQGGKAPAVQARLPQAVSRVLQSVRIACQASHHTAVGRCKLKLMACAAELHPVGRLSCLGSGC